ncbi:hypothetical protein J4403_01605 [Candidatus Woesearchaeota archaeon]|nr:hypothetical protein [Candidatus Woesearchaeota archaeon]
MGNEIESKQLILEGSKENNEIKIYATPEFYTLFYPSLNEIGLTLETCLKLGPSATSLKPLNLTYLPMRFRALDAFISSIYLSDKSYQITQGYLSLDEGMKLAEICGIKTNSEIKEIRLRKKTLFHDPIQEKLIEDVVEKDDSESWQAYEKYDNSEYILTLKGSGGISRPEKNKNLEAKLFCEYWPKTKDKRIDKIRMEHPFKNNYSIEFDLYQDRILLVAEFEVNNREDLKLLPILGKNVSEDPKYKNVNLAKPFIKDESSTSYCMGRSFI